MKKFLEKSFSRIPNSGRYVVLAITLMLLFPLFPTNATFKYKFNLGQTWLYEDFVSNVNFAILKDPSEIARERADLERDLSPYYELDLAENARRKKTFLQRFDQQLRQSRVQFPDVARNTEGYQNYGLSVLERLLNKGILKTDTFISTKDKEFVVNVLRGNTAERQTLQNILTPETAEHWLTDSLPFSHLKEPEFLLPLLEPLLTWNVSFNADKTHEFKQQAIEKIATARGMVKSGELIVPKGGMVTQTVYQKLTSFKEHYESDYLSSRKFYMVLFGYFILSFVILLLFILYLKYHAIGIYKKLRWLIFLLGWVVLYTYLMYGVRASEVLHPYIIPFCIAPIIIKNFYNRELAFVTHTICVLMAGLITAPGYEFMLLQMLAGLVVVFSRVDMRYWANFYQSILSIVIVYVVSFVGISFIEESNIQLIDWSVFIWLCLNGFLTLLAYPLIPLLGNVFGFVSSITLAELSDLGHPLLKELSLKAPGTLQHSLQVANLAEAAAATIGANELLIKVGALYHDIGKIKNPQYFIENQSGRNAHEDLSYIKSAKYIIEHVGEGLKLADKHGLPQPIIRFIETHHGTTLVEYFYRLHISQNTEGVIDKPFFQYVGPKPTSREETILMLADSLEAAAKSLKLLTIDSINALVEQIVAGKIAQRQLECSALSFGELELCKESFKKTLRSIHHIRIEYPIIS